MLAANRRRLLASLSEADVVLDLGGWADPVGRADWVMDLMPYETRGLYEREGWVEPRRETERFSQRTWLQRDLCDREPYPFADKQIDFVICSHTLEDLRDPLWVCRELTRIAKAGYIEVPSRLEEQSWGVNGPFVGWSHHRWLIDIAEASVRFVPKLHAIHAQPGWYFPAGFWEQLSDAERVQSLWWKGSFTYSEQLIMDDEQADRYLRPFVERELAARPKFRATRRRRGLAGAAARARRRFSEPRP